MNCIHTGYDDQPLGRTRAFLSALLAAALCLSGCGAGEETAAVRQPPPPDGREESVTLGGESYPLDAGELCFGTDDPEELAQALVQLPRFTELEFLVVSFRSEKGLEETDLSPLAQLPKLRCLTLDGRFPSLEALTSCPALEDLHLWGSKSQPLPVLPTVRRLYLAQSRGVDWSGVEAQPQLEYLYFSEVDTLPDFDRLAGHPTLKTIFICIDPEVSTAHDLSGWERTTVLDDPEDPMPEWLPLPQEAMRRFLSGEGREIALYFDP